MANLLLRRNGMGLESLRKINSLMSNNMLIRNDMTNLSSLRGNGNSYVFSWGLVRNIPSGYIVLNKPVNVAKTSNKGYFRDLLYHNNLTMKTYYKPSSLIGIPVSENDKYVVRPLNHFGGNDLYLVDNATALSSAVSRLGGLNNVYISKYIPKVKEFRVFVTSGKVVFIAEKVVTDPSSIAWNVHQGGSFVNVRFGSWDLNVVKHAIKAMNLSGLHYGAVDVIVDDDGKPYVLEINTSPTMTEDYWSGCVAKSFDYIIDTGVTDMNSPVDCVDRINWKHFIHPEISDKAINYLDYMNTIRESEPVSNTDDDDDDDDDFGYIWDDGDDWDEDNDNVDCDDSGSIHLNLGDRLPNMNYDGDHDDRNLGFLPISDHTNYDSVDYYWENLFRLHFNNTISGVRDNGDDNKISLTKLYSYLNSKDLSFVTDFIKNAINNGDL